MQQLSLNGSWELSRSERGKPPGDQPWLQVGMPDGDYSQPIASPRFFDDGEVDWWYRTSFTLPLDFLGTRNRAERVELVFDCLEADVQIWLNDRCLGEHGASAGHVRFDTCDVLQPDEPNFLYVRARITGDDLARLQSPGFAREVALRGYHVARIRDWSMHTIVVSEQKAIVRFEIGIERFPAAEQGARGLKLLVEGRDGENMWSREEPVAAKAQVVRMSIEVDQPRLWWPWDLGVPHLYDLSLTLLSGDDAIDTIDTRAGLREIRLRQDGGQELVFEINGVSTFVRGAIWPASRLASEQEVALLDQAIDLNLNLLRIQSDGSSPSSRFYDRCDALGILVWKDLLFTPLPVPPDNRFMQTVQSGAEHTIKTLRNHACLATWYSEGRSTDGLSSMVRWIVLAEATRRYAPNHPYIYLSPDNAGAMHVDADAAPQEIPCFITRLSSYGLPAIDGFQVAMTPSEQAHMDKLFDGVGSEHPVAAEDYVTASQRLQAKALYETIIAARQRRPDCGGVILDTFADLTPGASSAIIEVDGRPRLAYDAVKQAFAPLLLVFYSKGDRTWLWLSNDTRRALHPRYEIEGYGSTGRRLWHRTGEVAINALESRALLEVPPEILELLAQSPSRIVATLVLGDDEMLRTSLEKS